MLVAEYALRESVQREEMLQDKIRSLEKAAAIEPEGKVQLEIANNELDRARREFYSNQQALYRAEAMFLPSVKDDYEKLRSDESWIVLTKVAAAVEAVDAVLREGYQKEAKG
ncbi:hypothetical protein N7493_010506 [Penicillium malachiteum]|uniref:Uncharacterized protein n=1 Tax=Penicillium malachiteum TaxID=1324776 RepID=A0AAD6HCX5_9EURO|nr:hypothetical protein N7493_010506 [Penicillium malachiteum]